MTLKRIKKQGLRLLSLLILFTCFSSTTYAQLDSLTIEWWNSLDSTWQNRLRREARLGQSINQEALTKLYHLKA